MQLSRSTMYESNKLQLYNISTTKVFVRYRNCFCTFADVLLYNCNLLLSLILLREMLNITSDIESRSNKPLSHHPIQQCQSCTHAVESSYNYLKGTTAIGTQLSTLCREVCDPHGHGHAYVYSSSLLYAVGQHILKVNN